MRSFVAALLAGSAIAAYVPAPQHTVTSTEVATITSCPPGVPVCPGKTALPSTPVKPVTKAPEYTTSTIYSTQYKTITACPPHVSECPSKSTVVSTVVVPVSTTVCPVETGKPTPPASSPVKPVSPPPAASSPVKPVSPPYCATYTETCTVTVTAGPQGTGVKPSYKPTGGAPYPSGAATYPAGTGSPVKPTYPAQFTGAASHVKGGLLAAGAGAVAALLL